MRSREMRLLKYILLTHYFEAVSHSALTRLVFLQRKTITIEIVIEKAKTTPAKIPTTIFHSMQSSADARTGVVESGHRPKEEPSIASSPGDFPKVKQMNLGHNSAS